MKNLLKPKNKIKIVICDRCGSVMKDVTFLNEHSHWACVKCGWLRA